MIETSEFESLEPLIECRKLYYGENSYLTEEDKFSMTQVFAQAFEAMKLNG